MSIALSKRRVGDKGEVMIGLLYVLAYLVVAGMLYGVGLVLVGENSDNLLLGLCVIWPISIIVSIVFGVPVGLGWCIRWVVRKVS